MSKTTVRKALEGVVRTVLIVGIAYLILMPIVTKVTSSLMLERDLYDQTVKWIPRNLTLDNYRLVFENMEYPRAFFSSLALAIVASLLQLASCTFIGYGLARYRFRGQTLLSGLVILMLVVPPQTIMIPLYMNFRFFNPLGLLSGGGINLLGTVWPFVLLSLTGTGLRNGLFIYILRQFFRGIPKELQEAAYVDGAGHLRTLFSIVLPSAIPVLVTVFLFAFVWQWNDDFLTPLLMGGQTILPNTLNSLVYKIQWTWKGGVPMTGQYASLLNNTGMLLFIAPLLFLYAFMQRYFVESVERSGIVG